MYNRYTPRPDGSFQKSVIDDKGTKADKQILRSHTPSKSDDFLKSILPAGLDSADILVIAMLLLMSGEESGQSNALLTLVIYLFL